jgi:uncharacterized protein involved in outer membrane biogenesis
MKKAIIVILGILLLIIISAVFILPRVIALNKFKGRIEAILETSLNRKVFLGDIGLTFWPGIGAEVKDVRIANVAGFSDKDFARLKALQILIKILPLLTGNVKVDRFILAEPTISIEKNRAGKFNFSDLMEEEKKPVEKEAKEEKGARFVKGLMVSKASIDGGELRYLDYSKPQRKELLIQDIDLNLRDVSLEKPINFELSFRLKETPKKITLEGSVGPLGKDANVMEVPVAAVLEMKDLDLEPFRELLKNGSTIGGALSLNLRAEGRANEAVRVDLAGSIKEFSYGAKEKAYLKNLDVAIKQKAALNLREEKITIETGELSLGDLVVNMKGAITRVTSQPDLDVTVAAKDLPLSGLGEKFPAADALAGLTATGGINWSVKGQTGSNVQLTGNTSLARLSYRDPNTQETLVQDLDIDIKHSLVFDVKRDTLNIKDLALTVQETPVIVKGAISQLQESPSMDLNLGAEKIVLSKWKKAFPLLQETADVEGDVKINASLKGRLDRVVDIRFLVNSDRLEVDRVRKKESGQKQAKVHEKAKGRVEEKGDIFAGFDGEGKITIGQGRFEKITFQNFAANLVKKGGVFDLTSMAFDTFKGRITGKGQVDMTGKPALYRFDTKVDGVEAHEIYNTFASPKDMLFGLLLTDFTATGAGFEEQEFTKSLDAKGRLELRDGRLTTFSLLKEIASIANLLGVETYADETRFNNLSMNFKIESGRILTDNLSLTVKDFDLKASGNIGLDKTIDLSANAWLPSRLGGKTPSFTQYIFERDEKGRLLIPFRMAGSLMRPKLTLNTQALKTKVKTEVKEEVGKAIEKIPVEKETKEILKDILGR